MKTQRVALLDRDGTINVDHGYVSKIDDWEFAAGAVEGLRLLQDAGFTLAVVTNQSGIGRGYYSLEDMQRLHDYMQRELEQQGVTIHAVAFCAHDPDEQCTCRKPETGMTEQLKEQLGDIDYAHSWMIGDKEADMLFGKRVGAKTALIRSEYWQEDALDEQPDAVVDSLLGAAKEIASSK